mmetsp:Transcript_38538/g.81881  ORF Transcript_38538/g.81881 Transcript_38538/m.81881 type:complete len:224 (-) Transcript_38538:81-752(-)
MVPDSERFRRPRIQCLKQPRCTYSMEPLQEQGAMRGSSWVDPSRRQMRQSVVSRLSPAGGSALQTVPASSSRSSGCVPPQEVATSWRTRNLKRPSFITSPSARRWPVGARFRTTSQSFLELLEGAALSTQKAPSRCTRRSRGSAPGGATSRSPSICTSVPMRKQTIDLGTVKFWVCKWCASKSKRSWESRAQVLETTCTKCMVEPAGAVGGRARAWGEEASTG